MRKEEIIQFISDCQDLESGGFRPVQVLKPFKILGGFLFKINFVKCQTYGKKHPYQDTFKNPQQQSTSPRSPVQGHDPHLLNTLSAVQVAAIYDCTDRIDTEAVVR